MVALLGAFVIALTSAAGQQDPQTQIPQPTGRIAGTVTAADSGRPLPHAAIRLIRWEGGRGTQMPGQSDAQGRFEFRNLPAGSYQVTASKDRYVGLDFGQRVPTEPSRRIELNEGEDFGKADIALPPTSVVGGQLVDEFGDPVPGVVVQVARVQFAAGARRLLPVSSRIPVQPTDDLGQFRVSGLPPGDYYLLALSGPFAQGDNPSGFAPTFYPGTTVPSGAQAVHVESGRDVTGVSFALTPASMATVAGTIHDAAGRALPSADVFLYQLTGGDVRSMVTARMASGADGTFAFHDVAPGSYVVQAYGPPQGGGNLGRSPFGYSLVDVAGRDETALVITVAGATARGRVVFDGAGAPPPPGAVSILPAPVDFVTGPVGGGPPNTVTHDDYTFEVSNMSGRRVVRVNVRSAAWTLERVTLDGRDVTDEPIDFRKGDVDGLEVTLTSAAGTVAGTVTDNGAPAPESAVIVFADDPARWRFPSRYIFVARPDGQGRFRITGLPAAGYRAVAVPPQQAADSQDPEVLSRLLPLATPITLGEDASQTIALTLVKR